MGIKQDGKSQDKIDLLSKKLEQYIKSRGDKTIDLAHGVLKLRKKPDKVEVTDLEKFLAIANSDMLTIVPESVKPNLTKIKQVLKISGRVPEGITVIDGKEEYSLKIKEVSNDTTN